MRYRSTYQENGYPPDSSLIDYMRKKLQFERDREKSGLWGEELAQDRTNRNLKKAKVGVIERVFKSMANLIFFFKCIAEHPELARVFEDDVMDLLGVKRDVPQKHDVGYVFYDLLDYILIGREGGRYSEKEDNRADFRLILNHIAQKIICHKMRQSSVDILKMGGPRRVIRDDFDRVWAWTEILSRVAEQAADIDYELPPRRKFDFRNHDLSKEVMDQS